MAAPKFGVKRRGGGINITPFVDVLLVVLVIFILTSNASIPGIKVELLSKRCVKLGCLVLALPVGLLTTFDGAWGAHRTLSMKRNVQSMRDSHWPAEKGTRCSALLAATACTGSRLCATTQTYQ